MCGHSIKSNVFDWRDVLHKTEAHPPRSEYLLYECIILPFWTRSNIHLHDSFNLLRCHLLLFIVIVLMAPLLILVTLNNYVQKQLLCFFEHKQNYSAHNSHNFLCFGAHLNVHWIRPQTHWFNVTCCIWTLQNLIYKHCRSITLSKSLLMTLDGLPSKLLSTCVVVHYISSFHVVCQYLCPI